MNFFQIERYMTASALSRDRMVPYNQVDTVAEGVCDHSKKNLKKNKYHFDCTIAPVKDWRQ